MAKPASFIVSDCFTACCHNSKPINLEMDLRRMKQSWAENPGHAQMSACVNPNCHRNEHCTVLSCEAAWRSGLGHPWKIKLVHSNAAKPPRPRYEKNTFFINILFLCLARRNPWILPNLHTLATLNLPSTWMRPVRFLR